VARSGTDAGGWRGADGKPDIREATSGAWPEKASSKTAAAERASRRMLPRSLVLMIGCPRTIRRWSRLPRHAAEPSRVRTGNWEICGAGAGAGGAPSGRASDHVSGSIGVFTVGQGFQRPTGRLRYKLQTHHNNGSSSGSRSLTLANRLYRIIRSATGAKRCGRFC